jgi:hypothetical protein
MVNEELKKQAIKINLSCELKAYLQPEYCKVVLPKNTDVNKILEQITERE